jgi:predicted amidohydrolase
MNSESTFSLAAIQAAPVYYDRDASTEKACALIAEAGARGATLAAFGESWLPGFPLFAHATDSFDPDYWDAAANYIRNAVEVPSPTTDQLCEATKKAGIDVVIGIAERDPITRGTVYCSLLFIGRSGEILGVHRKLKPTFRERIVWGEGDASSLRVYERPYGRISGLNCWEHNMLLPGYVLMSAGTQVHVAAWPGTDIVPPAPVGYYTRQLFLSRAFASQGGCYVILASGVSTDETFPMEGGSCIIDPRGEVIAGPIQGEEILIADGTTDAIMAAKVAFDVTGHYSRPDLFQLIVNRQPAERVKFRDDGIEGDDVQVDEGN